MQMFCKLDRCRVEMEFFVMPFRLVHMKGSTYDFVSDEHYSLYLILCALELPKIK